MVMCAIAQHAPCAETPPMTNVQNPIVTVTLNPALDLSAPLAGDGARVVPGPKLRLGKVAAHPGGGGVNVARAIARLGGSVTALAALAGTTGAQVSALVAAEGLALIALPCPGETRMSLTVAEATAGTGEAEYRFVLPGPDWAGRDAGALVSAIAAQVPAGAWVVLSGSQPPGLAADFMFALDAALVPIGARLAVDTSGPALAAALAARGARPLGLLRLDQAEAEQAAGRALPQVQDSAGYAAALVAAGVAETVVLARGADGSVLADGSGQCWHCRPPAVEVASKVGAGDSLTGALILSLARGASAAEALRAGTAAAAAAVMTEGTELCRAEDVARLAPRCTLAPCITAPDQPAPPAPR